MHTHTHTHTHMHASYSASSSNIQDQCLIITDIYGVQEKGVWLEKNLIPNPNCNSCLVAKCRCMWSCWQTKCFFGPPLLRTCTHPNVVPRPTKLCTLHTHTHTHTLKIWQKLGIDKYQLWWWKYCEKRKVFSLVFTVKMIGLTAVSYGLVTVGVNSKCGVQSQEKVRMLRVLRLYCWIFEHSGVTGKM